MQKPLQRKSIILVSGKDSKIVQINFSAAFDRVDHQGILYKLCSVGIGRSVLSILTQFLSNRSKHIMVDTYQSKLVDVVSGVPHGSVSGDLLFILYTWGLCPYRRISLSIIPMTPL